MKSGYVWDEIVKMTGTLLSAPATFTQSVDNQNTLILDYDYSDHIDYQNIMEIGQVI